MRKEGISFGCLWGLLILLAYVFAFLGCGIYLIWNAEFPHGFSDWLVAVGSSIGYLLAGVIGLVPVILVSLYFTIKDRDVIRSVRLTWPLLLAGVYFLIPNIPGPIDDVIVAGVCSVLEIWFLIRRNKLSGPEGQADGVEIVEYRPPTRIPSGD
jgi:hypothetical protein